MVDPTTTTDLTHTVTEWAVMIMTTVGAALAALVARLIVIQIKRWDIKLSADEEARLGEVTRLAVLKAEELVMQRLRAGEATGVNADAKLQLATDDIIKKLPDVTQAEATDAVHAALPQLGLGALKLDTK